MSTEAVDLHEVDRGGIGVSVLTDGGDDSDVAPVQECGDLFGLELVVHHVGLHVSTSFFETDKTCVFQQAVSKRIFVVDIPVSIVVFEKATGIEMQDSTR